MSRRLLTSAAALVTVLGLGTAGATAAVAAPSLKSAPISVRVNHPSFTAGQTVHLLVHLGVPGGDQQVAIYRHVTGHAAELLGYRVGDVHGNFGYNTEAVYNASYTVRFAGSRTYAAVATKTRTLPVRVLMATALGNSYGSKRPYHLIHNGTVGKFGVAVLPAKVGEKVNFPLQAYYRGAWHTAVNKAYKLKAGTYKGLKVSSVGITFSYTKGYPVRIRAEYHGDKTNTGRASAWTYVRFV